MAEFYPVLQWLSMLLYAGSAVIVIARVWKKDRIPGWLPRVAALVGWAVQTTYIGYYCALAREHDFSSVSDIFLLASWSGALVYFVVSWLYRVSVMGAFMMPLVALAAFGALVAPRQGQALPDGVDANFLYVTHVLSAFLAYGAFFSAFASGVMFLAQERQLKGHRFGRLWSAMPSLETLDRAIARAALAGVILFTVGIGLGARGAGLTGALGSDWIREPKIVLTLITWTFFVALVSVRFFRVIHGRRAAHGAIAGFILVVITTLVRHGFG